MDVYNLYFEKIVDEIENTGFAGMREYIYQLEMMDEENRKPWERRLIAEIVELRKIKEDIKALETYLDTK